MSSALKIDLYQMKMLRAWFYHDLHKKQGTMEAFCRKLPNNRSYLIAIGITRIQEFLSTLKFTKRDIEIFKTISQLKIDTKFENYLLSVNFSEEIKLFAMDEGEVFFANEPILRIEGPIALLQYVEKYILSVLNHDVRIGAKAARVVHAAKGKPVYEGGGRRAHENTNIDIARATYIAGFAGSSNVEAYAEYGVPCFGSQGHVWIMSFKTEDDACKAWAEIYENPRNLVETYHYWTGTELAIKHSKKSKLDGIRLDSGDLFEESVNCRRLLNKSNCNNSKIMVSNDLNEYIIDNLLIKGAPIDEFLVGTEVVSTPDAPTCGFVLKLVSVEHELGINTNICKIADNEKGTWPGKKQIWRHYMIINSQEYFTHDSIGLNEFEQNGMVKPLLNEKLLNLTGEFEERKQLMEVARTKFSSTILQMPESIKLINNLFQYPITFTNEIINERNRIFQEKSRH